VLAAAKGNNDPEITKKIHVLRSEVSNPKRETAKGASHAPNNPAGDRIATSADHVKESCGKCNDRQMLACGTLIALKPNPY